MNWLITSIILILSSAFLAAEDSILAERQVPVLNFQHGEELVYAMKYGIIHGGNAILSLNESRYENKPVFHARAYARSVGLVDKLFKVEDTYESYFDPWSCLPFKAIRNIREGGYRYYNEVLFANADSLVFSEKSGQIEVPPDILDIVSSLYFLRRMNLDSLKDGDVIEVVTFFGDEVFPFPLRYRGTEIVKTKLGKFDCHRLDPVVEVGRIFESEDDMTLWISADENKIPMRVRFDMIVGGVLCDLAEYSNLCHDLVPYK